MWMLILVASARFAPLLRVPFAGWSARDGIKLTGEAGWLEPAITRWRPATGLRWDRGHAQAILHADDTRFTFGLHAWGLGYAACPGLRGAARARST